MSWHDLKNYLNSYGVGYLHGHQIFNDNKLKSYLKFLYEEGYLSSIHNVILLKEIPRTLKPFEKIIEPVAKQPKIIRITREEKEIRRNKCSKSHSLSV